MVLMSSKCIKRPKICILSSAPVTLWVFYRDLIQKLKAEGYDLEICSSPGKELDYFEKQFGIKVHQVDICRQITPWRDMLTILKLVKIFKRSRYDIVHAHTPKAGLLGMIAARLAAVRCRIYTCHGLPLETESGLKRQLLTCAEQVSCALAHQVLTVSYSLADKLTEYKICSRSKLAVLGDGSACGVNLKRFTLTPALRENGRYLRNKHGISDSDILIGFIGRLVPDKGIHLLVDTFVKLCETNNIRLLVIGDFEEHRGVLPEDTVNLLKEHPKIIYEGTTEVIENYYAAMDILVLPTKREGFPYTLLEGAAMGLPIVTTKVTGCTDAVLHGKTGLLVDADNREQLHEAIARLIGDEKLRYSYGCEARKRVESLFNSEMLIAEHLKLYKDMLEATAMCEMQGQS